MGEFHDAAIEAYLNEKGRLEEEAGKAWSAMFSGFSCDNISRGIDGIIRVTVDGIVISSPDGISWFYYGTKVSSLADLGELLSRLDAEREREARARVAMMSVETHKPWWKFW